MSLPVPQRSPTLADVIRNALDARLLEVNTAALAKVLRYDQTLQLVDVQPTQRQYRLDERNERVALESPVIPNVPVLFPSGGGFAVTFPLQVGDPVLLVFNHASTDEWLEQPADRVATPADPRRHDLTDAIAIPAPRPKAQAAKGEAGALTVSYGGEVLLAVKANGEVHLAGSPASEALALASRVDAQLTAIRNLLLTWAVVPSDGGAALKAAALLLWPPPPAPQPPTTGSSHVKAKD